MGFGEYVRQRRATVSITLRDFCKSAQVDPSNWSKVERGILPPPDSEEHLDRIASSLGIPAGSSEWHEYRDLAYAERGRIPSEIMADAELVAKLPIFFRTIRGEKPDSEELVRFAEKLRNS